MRVLLVDDNSTFLRIATRVLEERFAQDLEIVGTASGGVDALRQARELQPELILLDLGLPGLPRLQAVPLLRDALPGTRIICLTVNDSQDYRDAALKAGADGFIAKSALNTDLMPAIQQIENA